MAVWFWTPKELSCLLLSSSHEIITLGPFLFAGGVHDVYLLHLQVGIYCLFHRFYGMYPCHLLTYLREKYCRTDQMELFHKAVKVRLMLTGQLVHICWARNFVLWIVSLLGDWLQGVSKVRFSTTWTWISVCQVLLCCTDCSELSFSPCWRRSGCILCLL